MKPTFVTVAIVGAMFLCNSHAVIVALFGFFANMRIGTEYDYIPFESLFSAESASSLLLPASDNKTVTDMFYGFCTDRANPESRKCFPVEEALQHLTNHMESSSPKTFTPETTCRPTGRAILRGIADNLCHLVSADRFMWCHNRPEIDSKLTVIIVDADMNCAHDGEVTLSLACHVKNETGFAKGRVYCHYLYGGDSFRLRSG